MKVSICVVTQDNADFIKILLKSLEILKHTEALDIVIVDNYSNDLTSEIVSGFRDKMNLDFIHLNKRRSLPANRNLCVQKSKGDIIVMIDSDVEFLQPEFIENVVNIFVKNKDVTMLAPIIVDSRTGLVQSLGLRKLLRIPYIFVFNFPGSNLDNLRKFRTLDLFKIDMIHGACFIFRKSLFRDIGGFDEYMEPYNFDEMDFAIRANLSGYGLFASSTIEISHYGGGTTGRFKKKYRAELLIRHGMRSIIRNYSKKPVSGPLILFLFMCGSALKLAFEYKERSVLLLMFRSLLWALNHVNLPIENGSNSSI